MGEGELVEMGKGKWVKVNWLRWVRVNWVRNFGDGKAKPNHDQE